MRDAITKAVKRLDLAPADFNAVSLHRYEAIITDILNRFTTLGVRGLQVDWWWEHFKVPTISCQPPNALYALPHLIQPHERVWLVTEDRDRKKQDKFWLFEARFEAALKLLFELPCFEYYVVARDLSWLLCDNHHDMLIGAGPIMIERMQNLPDDLNELIPPMSEADKSELDARILDYER